MNHWDPQRFLSEGWARADITDSILQNAIDTAHLLRVKSPYLPPLFTLNHLSHCSEVPYPFLHRVIERIEPDDYRVFKLKKTNAGHATDRFRFICAPHPLLLKAQRWIHSNILLQTTESEASFAYRKDRGILRAAKLHTGCNWLIKLDITNFFESILEPDVYQVFRGLGYQPLVAFELARLCTRVRASGNPIQKKKNNTLPHPCGAIGHLPQGAATSPLLANLASIELDNNILQLAIAKKFTYTRYADDLVLSTKTEFTRDEALYMIHAIYDILRSRGLWPNRAKTKIVTPGSRKVVLGLLVDGPEPRLTKEFKEKVRTHIHFLSRSDVGPEKHKTARRFDSIYGLQRHIYGLVAFAYSVEPIWAQKAFAALKKVSWPKLESL